MVLAACLDQSIRLTQQDASKFMTILLASCTLVLQLCPVPPLSSMTPCYASTLSMGTFCTRFLGCRLSSVEDQTDEELGIAQQLQNSIVFNGISSTLLCQVRGCVQCSAAEWVECRSQGYRAAVGAPQLLGTEPGLLQCTYMTCGPLSSNGCKCLLH